MLGIAQAIHDYRCVVVADNEGQKPSSGTPQKMRCPLTEPSIAHFPTLRAGDPGREENEKTTADQGFTDRVSIIQCCRRQ